MVLNLSKEEQERIVNKVGLNATQVEDVSPNCNIQFLNLANNKIQKLPKNLNNLQNLVLAMNSLTVLPPTIRNPIASYKKLQFLDLSQNGIKDLGGLLEELPELKKICLFGNKLSDISFQNTQILYADLAMNRFTKVPKLPSSIKELNLDKNRITNINFDVTYMNLMKLCVAHNELSSITANVLIPNLFKIDISYNKLSGLDKIGNFIPRLHQFDLSNNKFTSLPNLPRTLTELYASKNKIKEIPEFVSGLNNLQVADFSHNKIQKIDVTLPPTLLSLNLMDNQITEIASSTLVGLNKIFLMQNKLNDVPIFISNSLTEYYMSRNCIKSIDLTNLSKTVTRIDISHNGLNEIPDELFTSETLTHLFVGYNNIKRIPDTIANSSLICLSVAGNQIEEFPEHFPQTLEQLFISDCNIDALPENLLELGDLIELDASNNSISEVPELKYLNRLILSKNNILVFPKISRKMEYLDLSFNCLTKLPDDFESKSLMYLDIAFNEICSLPKDINLPKLETLKLQSNPFISMINLSQFPSLEYIDTSSTASSFDSIENENLFISCSEPSICTNYMKRAIVSNGKADYALTRGIRESREDSVVIRNKIMQKIDLYSLIDGRGSGKSSLVAAYLLVELFIKEDDVFAEETAKKIYFKMVKNCTKNRILYVPDYGFAIRYENEIIALCTGLISMFIVGSEVREITSSEMLGRKRDITTLSRSHGPLESNYSEGNLIVYHAIPEPLVHKQAINPDDKWLIILSTAVRDSLTNSEIAAIANTCESASDIAYTIRNVALGNMCTDNISVVVVDLSEA